MESENQNDNKTLKQELDSLRSQLSLAQTYIDEVKAADPIRVEREFKMRDEIKAAQEAIRVKDLELRASADLLGEVRTGSDFECDCWQQAEKNEKALSPAGTGGGDDKKRLDLIERLAPDAVKIARFENGTVDVVISSIGLENFKAAHSYPNLRAALDALQPSISIEESK